MPVSPQRFRARPRSSASPRRETTQREGSAERGYDATWTTFREAVIHDHATCEHCWRFDSRVVPTDEVDHIIPITGPDDPLRLDHTNVRGLCRRHHARKTARIDRRARGYFDRLVSDGVPIDRAKAIVIERFRFEKGGGSRRSSG